MEDVRVKSDCRFRAYEHVRLKREFDRVFQQGRAIELHEICVRAAPNGLGHARLGLCVGKRHGNAVRRNRIKRLLREAYRLNRQVLTVPCDLVIVPRTSWRNLTLAAIEPVFREALSRIGKVFAPR
jgi:ribonuclease P protein component